MVLFGNGVTRFHVAAVFLVAAAVVVQALARVLHRVAVITSLEYLLYPRAALMRGSLAWMLSLR